MKKWIKWIIICCGALCVFIIILVPGAIFYINSDTCQNMIQKKIGESIPGSISWHLENISVLKGDMEIKNLLLKGPEKNKLIFLKRLYLKISPYDIFSGKLYIKKLDLEKPQVWIKQDKNGNFDISEAFAKNKKKPAAKPSGTGPPINIIIKSFKITDGSLNFEIDNKNPASKGKIDLKKIGLLIEDANLAKIAAKAGLEIASGNIVFGKIKTGLDNFFLKAELKNNNLKDIFLKLGSDLANLTIKGDLDNVFEKPWLDLHINLSGDLEKINKGLDLKQKLSGGAKIAVKVKGDPNDPALSFNFEYGGGNIENIDIDSVSFKGSLKERLFKIAKLNIESFGGNIDISGDADFKGAFPKGFITNDFSKIDLVTYNLKINQNGILLDRLPVKAGFKGNMKSRIKIKGQGFSPSLMSANGTMVVNGTNIALDKVLRPVPFNLKSQISLINGVASISNMKMASGKTQIKGDLTYHLDSQSMDGKLKIETPSLKESLAPVGINDVKGRIEFFSAISGTIKKPVLKLDAKGKNLGFKDISIDSLVFKGGLNEKRELTISGLDILSKKSEIKAKGVLQIFDENMGVKKNPGFDLKIAKTRIYPGDFIKNATGELFIDASLKGRLKSPVAGVILTGKSLKAAGYNIDALKSRLKFEKDTLNIEFFKVAANKSFLNVKGRARILDAKTGKILKNPEIDLKIDRTHIYLSDFVKDLKGSLVASADIKGSLKKPMGLVSIKGEALDLKMQKIDNLEAKLNLDGKKIKIRSLIVRPVKDEAIIAKGWVSPFDMNYDLNLYTKKISLKNLGFLPDKKFKDEILVFDFKGKGNFKKPSIKGKILLTGLKVNNKKIDDLDFYLDLKDNFAQIIGDPGFKVDGRFDLKKKNFSVFLKFKNTDLAPYLELAGKTGLKGKLDGLIEARGNIMALDKIKADADISGLTLFMGKTELIRSQNIKLLFENNNLLISHMNFSLLKKGYLNIKGQGKMGERFDFTAKGKIPLEVAAAFSEDLQDIKGDVKISAFVKGTASNPDFTADISLKNVGLTIPVLFQKLHGLNGNIKVSPDSVVFNKMRGMIDDGRFDIGGKIDLVKFVPSKINISFNAHTLPVSFPETVNILLNAGLKFEGTAGHSKLSGDIVLLEGLYYKDMGMNLLEAVKKKRSAIEGNPPETKNSFIDNMEIDIGLKYKAPFVIDNNLALMALKPYLEISGKPLKPVVKGRVSVESGTIKYQNHEFEIKEGIMDFTDPYRIDPDIRLNSEAVIRKWTINLQVLGTIENLKFILTSSPHLEHEDIISLIVFGKTAKELISNDGGSSFSATQVLANIVADKLKDELQNATGLDIVELNYKEGKESDDTGEVDVMLGKQLSRRLSVKYGIETRKGETIQKAVTEYKFLERFLINAFQDTAGDFGGELVYRIDFR